MTSFHLRTLTLSALVAATLLAAGCASNVPLEDKNAGGAAPISTANMPGGANASGANNSALASTSVAPVVIVATAAVTVAIAATVVTVVSAHPVPSRLPRTLRKARTSNNSSSERHEEAGCWQLEDARQPCVQRRSAAGPAGG